MNFNASGVRSLICNASGVRSLICDGSSRVHGVHGVRSLICDGSSDRCLDHANKDGNYGQAAKTRICRSALSCHLITHLTKPVLAKV